MKKPGALFFTGICLGLLLAGCDPGIVDDRLSGDLVAIRVSPADTDPAIDAWLEDHHACFHPGVYSRSTLYLHFPGTTDLPVYNQLILREAAGLGLHAIGLCYPNSMPLWNTCGHDPDPDSFEKVRLEILDGRDRSDRVEISGANSILNRLVRLLEYLDRDYPAHGWNRFLDRGQPVWSRIRVGGHSQGGGHAAMVARVYGVDRVLMFASPGDYSMVDQQVAPWIPVHATPTDRYVGFYHIDDTAIRFNRVWAGLGLNCPKSLVCVDVIPRPYGNSQCLFTTVSYPSGPNANPHNCIIRDENLPITPKGDPVFKGVWRYMLTGE